YAGQDRIKLSPGKSLLPGRKQIFRVEREGIADHDVLARHDEVPPGRPLLQRVMSGGTRLPAGRVSLEEARRHARNELRRLAPSIRSITPAEPPYRVDVSERLQQDLENAVRHVSSASRM